MHRSPTHALVVATTRGQLLGRSFLRARRGDDDDVGGAGVRPAGHAGDGGHALLSNVTDRMSPTAVELLLVVPAGGCLVSNVNTWTRPQRVLEGEAGRGQRFCETGHQVTLHRRRIRQESGVCREGRALGG